MSAPHLRHTRAISAFGRKPDKLLILNIKYAAFRLLLRHKTAPYFMAHLKVADEHSCAISAPYRTFCGYGANGRKSRLETALRHKVGNVCNIVPKSSTISRLRHCANSHSSGGKPLWRTFAWPIRFPTRPPLSAQR